MMKRCATALVVFCGLAIASPALAGPIIFFSQDRYVSAGGSTTATTSTGSFVATESSVEWFGQSLASQTTVIGSPFIGGAGLAEANITFFGFDTYSVLRSTFILDESYTANLAVTLVATGQNGFADVALLNLDTFSQYTLTAFNSTQIATFSGTLTPGRYFFQLMATVADLNEGGTEQFSGTASFNGGLTLTPLDAASVPEPASMTLVGLGLAAVWRCRRKLPGARHQ